MAAEAPHAARSRSRTRLFWLIGLLCVVAVIYLCLPKSWFEIPDTNPRPARPASPPTTQAPSASLEALRTEAAQRPLDYGARSRYGMALAAAGNRAEALKEFLAAARLAPNSPGVYYNLGIFYLNSDRRDMLDRADAAFCHELELTPGDGRVHYFRGLIFERRLQNAQAISQFQLARALAPNLPDTYLSLALLLTRQQPEQSRQLIDDYIRLSGDKTLAYYVLSGAYKTRHEYPEAAHYAETTVQMDPNNFGYWHNLGQIYFLAGRAADADRILQHALVMAKDKSDVLIELGMNAQKAGKLPQAVDYLHQALAASPQLGFIHLYLARIYPRMGDSAAAQREETLFRQWQRAVVARQSHGQLRSGVISTPKPSDPAESSASGKP